MSDGIYAERGRAMMVLNGEQRDAIFKTFGRAFFKQDLDLMYEAVTPDFTWTIYEDDALVALD
ncbi:MAG: hypothetical protein VX955_16430, partial [Pseudomonadota bacterium]|nr:hypothetical protein [Pseudomonadota bacterium]